MKKMTLHDQVLVGFMALPALSSFGALGIQAVYAEIFGASTVYLVIQQITMYYSMLMTICMFLAAAYVERVFGRPLL
jgi:energy-converting hydrogenase Eha subunit A